MLVFLVIIGLGAWAIFSFQPLPHVTVYKLQRAINQNSAEELKACFDPELKESVSKATNLFESFARLFDSDYHIENSVEAFADFAFSLGGSSPGDLHIVINDVQFDSNFEEAYVDIDYIVSGHEIPAALKMVRRNISWYICF